LSLPATATVLFAGLYWGGDTSGGTSPKDVEAPNPKARGCAGFKVPGPAGYKTLTGSVDASTSTPTRYGAFVDVTSLIQAAGPGTYSVANVQAGKGGDRYAGWTLVVAYRDPTPARAQPDG
jgi:large repetitive protein